MARYRVKAYFMHEHEQDFAEQAVQTNVIAESEMTNGYVTGVIDEHDIAQLKNDGLVLSVIEQVEETPIPLAVRVPPPNTFNVSFDARMPAVPAVLESKDKVGERSARRSYYIVRFRVPLTDKLRAELKHNKIVLNERRTRNQYTVELLPTQVDLLAASKNVDFVRLYTVEDTLAGAAESIDKNTGKYKSSDKKGSYHSRQTCVYNVTLHDPRDLIKIKKWLVKRDRKPIWARNDQLQVALLVESEILRELASRPEVASIEQANAPRLYDDHARTILGLISGAQNIGLEGEGEIIGIADTGIDDTHPDFAGRIVGAVGLGRPGDTSDPEGHGTHVAGCVLGDGTASGGLIVGAAPKAQLFFQSVLDPIGGLGGLPTDIGDLLQAAYDQGVRIHNNSWGAFSFAHYGITSLDVDEFVAEHPDMLVVIAAGNDGLGVPRAAGAVMSSAAGFVDWPCVAAPATAKNGLTVGASRSTRESGGLSTLKWGEAWPDRYPDVPIADEFVSRDADCLAAFSSRGPSNDLRIKPDVVAPGTDIVAAKSKDAPLHKFWGAFPHNNQYAFLGGTSMAAPYVAGCAALVREWYRTQGNWDTPSAALLKATLINGTRRMIGADSVAPKDGDPNYHQGFGRIDMAKTVPNPLSPDLKLEFADTWMPDGRVFDGHNVRFRYQVDAGGALDLRFCLAWTDPPARGLQNTLTLIVDNQNGQKWTGNSGASSVINVAGLSRDPNNNIQTIRITNPQPGTYTIGIFAEVIMPPQTYALVVTGDLTSPLLAI